MGRHGGLQVSAADFTRDLAAYDRALATASPLAGSTCMATFLEAITAPTPAMIEVSRMAAVIDANRDKWAREDAEAGK